MTRGTDMDTDTMPRTFRQPPGRPVPPGRAPVPSGRTLPPGRTAPPPGRTASPPGRTLPSGRTAPPPGRTTPPGRAEPPGRPERGRANPDAPGRARPGTADPRARPLSAPRHTRPVAGQPSRPAFKLRARRAAWAAAASRPRPRHPRAPFILLLVGLLGGALISMLMISTTLAEGSFRISNLQQQNTNLARQEQLLSQQVAQAESPTQIAQEAEQFGMQQNPNLRFINLKTGKIVAGKVSQADAAINVAGYTP